MADEHHPMNDQSIDRALREALDVSPSPDAHREQARAARRVEPVDGVDAGDRRRGGGRDRAGGVVGETGVGCPATCPERPRGKAGHYCCDKRPAAAGAHGPAKAGHYDCDDDARNNRFTCSVRL
jgi:hypothetical protein